MKDYSYLEGKEVTVIYDVYGEYHEFTATITGCEYDIGISIEAVIEEEKLRMEELCFNNTPYFFCIQGPMAPDFKYTASYRTGRYDEYFNEWIKMLESGVVIYSKDNEIRKRLFREEEQFGQMASCAFI